jgi:4-amino-4-deoxy-L-arabinose transferase-like glycosyltransferase
MFDQENLEFILRSAGFEGVRARDFDPSIDLAALRFGLVVSLDPALTGMIASFLAGGLAAVGLGRLIASVGGASTWGVLAWVTAPTVVFVTAPWSEGLFAAFAFWAWYLARKGHWWWAGLLAGGAILTRINGVFLVVGLAAVWWFSQPRKPRNLLPLLIPVVVIGVHFTYLWTLTGRWDEWRAAHEEFWGRQTVDPITAFANSWGLIFEFTPGTISTRFIAEIVGALIIACAVAVLVIKRWWPEAIYVSLTLLSLITSSFYYSIPRSITVLFPIWMLVGVLFVRRPWTRWAYLVAVLPLTLLVVIRFIDGQWIS